MGKKRAVNNLLALAVLAYLSQRAMHPYEIGRMLREHGDSRSIRYNPGSLYMVVGQLARAELIAQAEISRQGQLPERTVYRLTPAGRQELYDWLRELIVEPRHEYPSFVAALSLIGTLPPETAVELLRSRLAGLAEQHAEATAVVRDTIGAGVPELFVVEEQYRLALLEAETAFVERLVGKITDPGTAWSRAWAEAHARLTAQQVTDDGGWEPD